MKTNDSRLIMKKLCQVMTAFAVGGVMLFGVPMTGFCDNVEKTAKKVMNKLDKKRLSP
jgi:hypothetical protein